MQFYHGNFLALAFMNAALGYREYSRDTIRLEQKPKSPAEGFVREKAKGKITQFKRRFIPLYLAVNGADWLQVSWEILGFSAP